MKPWNCLLSAEIQGQTIQCTITVHSAFQDKAERLARISYINLLRRMGAWAEVTQDKDEEDNEFNVYHAPGMEHVKFIEFVEMRERDLTFPPEELAPKFVKGSKGGEKPKRKTSGEAALDKKVTTLKKLKVKGDKLQPVLDYFKEPNTLKDAAKVLGVAYQVVRYRVQQITDKGVGADRYELIESQDAGMKTIQLKKKL